MSKNLPFKKVDRSKYLDFKNVADNFKEAAEIANEFGYFNAAGVLIIHSAIALADAITIKFSSKKMKGESHYDVIALLQSELPDHIKNSNAVQHFSKLIDHKNLVSYSGDIYYKKDIDKLFKSFNRFSNWAKKILED